MTSLQHLCYSVYQKDSKVVTELHRQIQLSKESEKILLKICEVLISTEDEYLKETAAIMKSLLHGTYSKINFKTQMTYFVNFYLLSHTKESSEPLTEDYHENEMTELDVSFISPQKLQIPEESQGIYVSVYDF